MITLHRATELTKKLLFGLTIGVISIILIVILVQYILSLIPKKVTPPTVTFGPLPAVTFPSNTLAKNFTYTINTLSGQLPVLPDRVAVYKLAQPQISLLSLDQAKDLMTRNNIPGNPIKISDTLYQWQQPTSPFAKIIYDIVTNNFTFTTNYLTDPAVATAPNLPDPPGAILNAQGFFANFSADMTDINMDKTQTIRYSISNGTLVPAASITDTQVIRVDFYQNDLDKIPIYYPHYPQSTIYAIIAGVDSPNLTAEAGYHHQSILMDENGTYPIKTAQEAFAELTKNNAYFANYNGTKSNILIKDAYLAYFAGDTPQQYLMPIIVFTGNDNFYAYVSAIKDNWISK